MIIKTLDKYDAWREVQEFSEGYKNKYSQTAFFALFDYMENLSEDLQEDLEFDFIAWACDWTEYENLDEVKQNYTNIKSLEELQEKTEVIELENNSLLVRNY